LKQTRLAAWVAFTLTGLWSAPAFAQTDVLTNGSFEAGLTGWSQSTQLTGVGASGTCGYNGVTAPGN
jgi:hypothetical protein